MKTNMAVFFGCRSVEHEVSVISAVQAMNAIDRSKYEVIPVYVTKDGEMFTSPLLFDIESFNQVHHMVSEVEAVLKTDVNPFEVLMSALPGGSITGAPKIRAMQIIYELEDAPRGAYCGSMGYFNHDGTGSWNILIRSIQNTKIRFRCGQVAESPSRLIAMLNIKNALIKSKRCWIC